MEVLDSQPMGLEGSGIIEAVGSSVLDFHVGDHVSFLHRGCFSTRIKLHVTSCTRIPHGLSFEEAATMPCVYATAIHCLLDIGRLQKGETVLIHSGCGGKQLSSFMNAVLMIYRSRACCNTTMSECCRR